MPVYDDLGEAALRPSHRALLALVDPSDPAWPATASVLREMTEAGVELDDAAVRIATQLGAHRHRLAMIDPQRTRAGQPAYLPPPMAAVDGPIVYYVRRGDLIKIGTTADPPTRFDRLMPDEILAVEPGGEQTETYRHRQFGHLHCRGEYFRAAPELVEHARQVRARHGDPDPAWTTTSTPAGSTRQRRTVMLPPLTSRQETITVADAQSRLGVAKGTLWSWVHRNVISPVGRNDAGHQVFFVQHLEYLRDRR